VIVLGGGHKVNAHNDNLLSTIHPVILPQS